MIRAHVLLLAVVLASIGIGGRLAGSWLHRRPDAYRHATVCALLAGALVSILYALFPTACAYGLVAKRRAAIFTKPPVRAPRIPQRSIGDLLRDLRAVQTGTELRTAILWRRGSRGRSRAARLNAVTRDDDQRLHGPFSIGIDPTR